MKKLDVLVTGGGDNKSSDLSMVLFSGLILSYKPIKTINRGIMNRRIVGAGSEDEKINEYESYNVFIPGAPSKESCLYNCMMKQVEIYTNYWLSQNMITVEQKTQYIINIENSWKELMFKLNIKKGIIAQRHTEVINKELMKLNIFIGKIRKSKTVNENGKESDLPVTRIHYALNKYNKNYIENVNNFNCYTIILNVFSYQNHYCLVKGDNYTHSINEIKNNFVKIKLNIEDKVNAIEINKFTKKVKTINKNEVFDGVYVWDCETYPDEAMDLVVYACGFL